MSSFNETFNCAPLEFFGETMDSTSLRQRLAAATRDAGAHPKIVKPVNKRVSYLELIFCETLQLEGPFVSNSLK